MPQEDDMKRQPGAEPDAGDRRDRPSQFVAGRRQFDEDVRHHVEAGHGEQRTYSPRGVASDGTYVGHAGGYVGGRAVPRDQGGSGLQSDRVTGEGTYGFPYGQGIGLVGERHPDDYAKDLGGVGLPDERRPDPGDRFGAGRNAEWRSPSFDPGFRDAEYEEFRNAHGRHLDRDYRDYTRERGQSFDERFEEWRARRRRAAGEGEGGAAAPASREEDSGF